MLRHVTFVTLFALGYVAWSPRIVLAQEEQGAAERAGSVPWDRAKDGVSIGMTLHRFQDDFGLGATVSTPAIAHMFRFTLGGGVAWYPYGHASDGSQAWDAFGHGRAVVEIGPGYLKGVPIRPYGFSGLAVIVLPSTLSNDHVALGGLGGFGFEVAFGGAPDGKTGPVTYYLELGGIGTGATASKVVDDPSIASGFLITTGLRAYL